MDQIAAVDFFTIPTISFRVLFCFLVLRHDRRKVVHFNVNTHPTAFWTGQRMVQAFPEDSAPRYVLQDQDEIYGCEFGRRLKGLGMDEVITTPRSPFQNPYAERLVGSIRQECLDHVIVLNENHLRTILRFYLSYYHEAGHTYHWNGTRRFRGKSNSQPKEESSPSSKSVVYTTDTSAAHKHLSRCIQNLILETNLVP